MLSNVAVRRLIAAAAVATAAALAAGCAGQAMPSDPPPVASMPQVCTKNGPVVFAVGGRENRPTPVMTGSMYTAAAAAVAEGSAIGLVDLDGRPRLIRAGAFRDPGVNALAKQAAQRHFLGSLQGTIEHTRAAYPHADVLTTLNVAGRAVRAACPHGGTIFLEDSGLQEMGLVNFRQLGMLGARPADVVSFLAHEDDLPHLADIALVLVGCGDTAPPQRPLSISQQDNVVAIWSAIARAGGASSVRVDESPLSAPAPVHVPHVLLVPVPADSVFPVSSRPGSPGFVFPDSGPVGFQPDTAVFRDPAAADTALRRLARYLAAHPAARIELTGTTANWGPFAGAVTLSWRRADTVKAALAHMGAAPGQIKTRGLGWRFPGYINDQGPAGTLLPGPAEHNRSVIVTKA
jgi:outer membrane protein OmpA-like peptidoglycan-associated protein